MNLVKLELYAQAFYSGSVCREVIYLLEEDYNKLERDMQGEELCVGELDGKHSEVFGEVEVTVIPEEEQESYTFEEMYEYGTLYYDLFESSDSGDIQEKTIKEMMQRAKEYIESIDCFVEVTYKVKRSKIDYLNKIAESCK